jgi:hypothetical protein
MPRLLYSIYEIVDRDGIVLEKTTQQDVVLSRPGRSGDFIRETRASVTSTAYIWQNEDKTWRPIN